jgi:hypothetical protein
MIFSVILAHLFILDSVVDGRPLLKLQTLSAVPDEKKKRTTDVQIYFIFFAFAQLEIQSPNDWTKQQLLP